MAVKTDKKADKLREKATTAKGRHVQPRGSAEHNTAPKKVKMNKKTEKMEDIMNREF